MAPSPSQHRGRPHSAKPPLIFVEPYSNPSKDTKRRDHQTLVKRWSMLNRNANIDPPTASAHDDDDGSSPPTVTPATGIKGRLIPQRLGRFQAPKPLPVRHRKQLQAACGFNPDCQIGIRADPFDAMAAKMDADALGLLRFYLDFQPDATQLGFSADDSYSLRLTDASKHIWAPLALSSTASSYALLAFAAATCGAREPSHPGYGQLERHLGQALSATNSDLRSPSAASGNGVIMSIALLLLVARSMGDDNAFAAHCKGVEILLQHRRKPSLTGLDGGVVMHPVEMLFNQGLPAFMERPVAAFVGSGFLECHQKGFISVHSWEKHWPISMMLSRLVLETGRDLLWYTVLQQHMHWLVTAEADQLAIDPVDKMLRATLRLGWHLVVFQGLIRPSPVLVATTAAMRESFAAIDLDVLGSSVDWALLWVALMGCATKRTTKWFRSLLRFALRRLGDMELSRALVEVERRFFWHPMLDRNAGEAWAACTRQALPPQEALLIVIRDPNAGGGGGGCCKGDGKVELDKQCLCAWWT